jgi:hypothetical protein
LEEERRKEMESIKFYEEQVRASERLHDEKAKKDWQEKKDLAESKLEFLTKQKELKSKEEAELLDNSKFNTSTALKVNVDDDDDDFRHTHIHICIYSLSLSPPCSHTPVLRTPSFLYPKYRLSIVSI